MNTEQQKTSFAVETHDLTQTYGKLTALNNLNLQVEHGDLFGFIGSNGAGKTTTLKILSLFLQPTRGTASVCGYDIHTQSDEVRKRIGYMPDFFGVYKDMEVTEYLDFFGACYQIPQQKRTEKIRDVLHLVGLSEKEASLIGSLSRGMQQRLGLARVLIHDPQLLLLDEPASGLDPRARIEMMTALLVLRKVGKTIIISSHILSELQTLCNRVGIIEKGNLLYCGSMEKLKFKQGSLHSYRIRILGDPSAAISALRADNNIHAVEQIQEQDQDKTSKERKMTSNETEIRVTLTTPDLDGSLIPPILVGAGIKLTLLTPEETSLEQTFLKLTRGQTQ